MVLAVVAVEGLLVVDVGAVAVEGADEELGAAPELGVELEDVGEDEEDEEEEDEEDGLWPVPARGSTYC